MSTKLDTAGDRDYIKTMEAKRIVRVYEYRYDSADKQTCICTTEIGNIITLWDELPKSEVVRLKTKEIVHGTESVQG